jgi:WS/DGAT/MGAT family acyltransferase
MADRMSPLDAAFLDLEDEDAHVSMAISSVAILDGPAPSHAELTTALLARLPLVPRYRQKLRQVPLDLGRPVWVDDPAFDPTHHLRRTAVPAPGDDETLCRLVGRIMSQRLDRDRPLWEYWVVEGLAGGRWALISKVHHSLVDGVSGTHLYYLLLDREPQASATQPVDRWSPAAEPSTLRLVGDALVDLALSPVEQVRLAARAVGAPRLAVRRVAETVRGLTALAGALKPAAASSLVGPIGQQRRYAVARASMADVHDIRQHAQVSLNDVVLAAITGGFRTLLRERGERLDPHAIRSLVPVSVRAAGDEGICDNRLSLLLAFLPVHLAEPTARLRAVHAHLKQLKASNEAQAGEAMTTLAKHEPFPPISWGMRLAAHVPQRNIVTVTTNVPGPREPLYLLGRRVVEVLPYVPIAARLRTGVSIFTYCDQLTFGVTGDYASAPDVDLLASGIEVGVRELAEAYRTSDRSNGRIPAASKTANRAEPAKAMKAMPAKAVKAAPRGKMAKAAPTRKAALSEATARKGASGRRPSRLAGRSSTPT